MKLAVCLPDTQDDAPSIPIKLTRVGVTGVKKLLQLKRTNKRVKEPFPQPIFLRKFYLMLHLKREYLKHILKLKL